MSESEQSKREIEPDESFEAPDNLDQVYEQTIRDALEILGDDDRPAGFHLTLHRGDGIGFATGMGPKLVDGTGPTLPVVEMVAHHLWTVHQRTNGMDMEELALAAADYAEDIDDAN